MALRDPFPFFENPSFSLGLAQEEQQDHTDGRSSQEPETVEEGSQVKLPQRRKSLRLQKFLDSTLLLFTLAEQVQNVKSIVVLVLLVWWLKL